MSLLILFIVGALLMYCEGFLVSAVLINFSPLKSKWLKFLALIIWPIAVPYLAYKIYSTYAALISQVKDNPLLGSMLGGPSIDSGPFNFVQLQDDEPSHLSEELRALLAQGNANMDAELEEDNEETQGN